MKATSRSILLISAILAFVFVVPAFAQNPSSQEDQDGCKLLDRALDSYGLREKLAAIHAVRYKGDVLSTFASKTVSGQVETIVVFPESVYRELRMSTVRAKVVVTPELSYMSVGQTITDVPAATLEDLRFGLRFDPLYIAQHRDDYVCVAEGTDRIGNVTTAKVKIVGPAHEVHWDIDPLGGRLLRVTATGLMAELSDWRQVDGVYIPFKRHIVAGGRTTDVAISEYQINPPVDASLFEARTVAGLTRRQKIGLALKILGGAMQEASHVGQDARVTLAERCLRTPGCNLQVQVGDAWQSVTQPAQIPVEQNQPMRVDTEGNYYNVLTQPAWSISHPTQPLPVVRSPNSLEEPVVVLEGGGTSLAIINGYAYRLEQDGKWHPLGLGPELQ